MKKLVVLDIECYPNYFLIAFKGLGTNKVITVDTQSKLDTEQKRRIKSILNKYTTFGYNSINYDIPMLTYALNNASVNELYELSKTIVEKGQPSWMSYRNLDLEELQIDHFDIKEPAPAVMISLKNYGTRVGSKKLWDLPYNPHKRLNQEQIENLKLYCENDLDTTIDLYNAIKGRLQLRIDIGKEWNTDFRSKSDAQMAEEMFKLELAKNGKKIQYMKAKDRLAKHVEYKCPDFITFESKELNEIKDLFDGSRFEINQGNGQPILPKEWTKFIKPKIGETVFKLGLGGIHSQEKKLSIKANDKYVLRNADIASMYPSIILLLELYPTSLGKDFLSIYRKIYETRLKAKKTGDKLVNEGLKIALNGSYGKFGSFYSFLYAPDLMLTVTLTGQLMMLMLIEQLEKNDFRVISANTDGVEYYCERDRVDEAEALIFDWELDTGMVMEHGEYQALHAKDVNNYVAVYDGYVKSKGLYAETSLMKGRSTPIVYEAIRKYLLDGTSLQDTIYSCDDINEFVSGRTVNGGAEFQGKYLGKVVRWYYCKNSDGYIYYSKNGNKVPKTDGCCPLMDLPDEIPNNLNYQWYIEEAILKLNELGVYYA